MSLVGNERIKLLAGALNNTAVATIVAGILGPAAGMSYGLYGTGANRWWFIVGAIWFLVGIGLHYSAQQVLRRLKE
jgi:hypothetical protein